MQINCCRRVAMCRVAMHNQRWRPTVTYDLPTIPGMLINLKKPY